MNERDRTKFSNLSFRISLAEKNMFLVRWMFLKTRFSFYSYG